MWLPPYVGEVLLWQDVLEFCTVFLWYEGMQVWEERMMAFLLWYLLYVFKWPHLCTTHTCTHLRTLLDLSMEKAHPEPVLYRACGGYTSCIDSREDREMTHTIRPWLQLAFTTIVRIHHSSQPWFHTLKGRAMTSGSTEVKQPSGLDFDQSHPKDPILEEKRPRVDGKACHDANHSWTCMDQSITSWTVNWGGARILREASDE